MVKFSKKEKTAGGAKGRFERERRVLDDFCRQRGLHHSDKRTLIIQALAKHKNNVSAAARDLSVDPANLHRMIKSLDIDLV